MYELAWRYSYTNRELISFVLVSILGLVVVIFISKAVVAPLVQSSSEISAFIEYEASEQPVVKQEPLKQEKVLEKVNPKPVHVQEKVVVSEAPSQIVKSSVATTSNEQVATSSPIKEQIAEKTEQPKVANPVPHEQQTAVAKAESHSTVKYENYVIAYLEKAKRYPTSREARQSRPQGIVKVWLEINRAGEVLAYGVAQSSGSNLLDNEALKLVKNGEFPPFPEEVYSNEPSHKFLASLKYELS